VRFSSELWIVIDDGAAAAAVPAESPAASSSELKHVADVEQANCDSFRTRRKTAYALQRIETELTYSPRFYLSC